MNIKFSITIPAFKVAFLEECIESCLNQTYSNFEVIIVDDCSPQDIRSVVDRYSDSRIHYYRNVKNCGAIDVVDNWNICLSYCTGDYVICMGDDDRLLPCCLEEYSKLIDKYPGIGLVHGWTEIIDENGKFSRITEPRPEYESVYSLLWNRWDNRKLQFIGDWCFEVEWLRSHGGFYKLPLAWASDDISALIGASKNGVTNTQVLCFQYRSNSQTISSTGNVDVKVEAVSLEKNWYEQFLSEAPNDELDRKYWKCAQLDERRKWDKKYALNYCGEIRKNPFKIIKWYNLKKKYGYTNKSIMFAIYMAIKGK